MIATPATGRRRKPEILHIEEDPLWYKDALIYELHVRAFMDSDADGSGDFRGLIEKLPYLQDLGINALWLLPYYPSPMRDDGYDIADYNNVNPMFGTLGDVSQLIREAHRRGIRVINELVCNHTSDQHPWFQRARRAKPGTALRDFYVWSETNQRYQDARIIFKDFETSNWTWDHVANAYYWHRFYSHQPDLNFDNPKVHEAMFKALDFWMELGIDGVRLDAVPYLYEREGTNGENLPETHQFLKDLRRHVDENFRNRMLLAEANQWPEDAVAYFGQGDECQMSFHFPLMPRLFMSIRMEDRFPIVDILAQTPSIPDSAQWALFLRNHDELTLEMVTDEERDYMYRAYTQDRLARLNLGIRRRLAPLLGNDRRRIELMNGLLFSLPGTPVLYYGDEIGMGDNIFLGDRNGVRTPMQWSADRNAGFSRANRQRLYLPVITDPEYHYETVNVEAQQGNPHSIYSWTKRLIALRKRHRAFGRGSLELLRPENRKVLAYVRRYESEQILCIANLSRFLQAVELDLSQWKGLVPVELFSSNEMPVIGENPYFLTLGPHAFYWFAMQPRAAPSIQSDGAQTASALPEVRTVGGWESALVGAAKDRLESILLGYIPQRRWFGGKARRIKTASIVDVVTVPGAEGNSYLTSVVIGYAEGDPDTYMIPIAYANAPEAPHILERWPISAIAWVRNAGEEPRGLLYDALGPPNFAEAMLGAIARRRRATGGTGTLVGSTTRAFARLRGPETIRLEAQLSVAEQSNNSVIFGERLMLKVFRRLEEGVNPELEVGRFLTEKTNFAQIAPLAGSLEYRRGKGEPVTISILQGYVPNQGDAWQYTLNTLAHFFSGPEIAGLEPPRTPRSVVEASRQDATEVATRTIGGYLESARLLGRRTAELHAALSSDPTDLAFAPERISPGDQRSIYQSLSGLSLRATDLLRTQVSKLPAEAREEARKVLDLESRIAYILRSFLARRLNTTRIRVHGDYHLGQVLYTGHDFVIIDFEGEPTRTLYERRLKRLAMRDVAGMLRSFSYASQAALRSQEISGPKLPSLQAWARFWVDSVSAVFLKSYLATAGSASWVPQNQEDLELQLTTMLLEKALYELRYELNLRPDWVRIPLRGILDLVAPA
ncbi:MAG: maltose alpha-D-glucosyltransferase [Chloroflexi bacterium]|nr:MAG: maltose alpha-D-glucosyltransferase [Chloroflexota bacterium]TME55208.1 MAG: maltose alpha-D-glucosyltransferase [Chloroflexota bacterium]